MTAPLNRYFARSAEEASDLYLEHYKHERGLEVDPQNPDVLRQFRDIREVPLLFPSFEFGNECLTIPRAARILTRKLSNHIHWVESSDVELACHHSRYVRMLASALSITSFLDSHYHDWAVQVLEEKVAHSTGENGIFISNIKKRIDVINGLAVSAIRLPTWPSPKEVADRIRSFRKYNLFEDASDVLEAVRESRSR